MPINRECPKCGEMNARVRHCRALEQMELTCLLCKYEWQLKPLDVLRADKECQAATAQETPAAQPKFKGDMLEHLKALMKTQETPAALVSVPCALCGMQAISDAPCHGNCGRLGCPGIHLIEPA